MCKSPKVIQIEMPKDGNQNSCLKIREIARLDLVNIFLNWGLQVKANDLKEICENWRNLDRDDFIMDLINKYIHKLDFQTFRQIYRLLEVIDKQDNEVNEFDLQYIKYCIFYCRKLMETKRYKEAIEIVSLLMNIHEVKIDYTMLVQCYIQGLVHIFPNQIEKGRQYIDFFVQNYDTPDEYKIRQLLEEEFSAEVLDNWQRSSIISIDYHYCFDDCKKKECLVNLDSLWDISLQESQSTQELYYTYFFLSMGLNNPKRGFGETVGISYNLEKMTNILLGELDTLFDKNQDLWFVDYATILAKFLLGGILSQAAYSLNINVIGKDQKSKFQLILKQLRFRKSENQRNDKILNILTKLKAQIFNRAKRNQRKQRFRNKLKQIIEEEAFKNRSQMLLIQSEESQEQQSQVLLTWKKVQEQKKAISSISDHLIDEKQLIDQIYQINNDSKTKSPGRMKPRRSNIFENLFGANRENEKIENIIEMIKDKKYSQLALCSLALVVEGIQKLFQLQPYRDYSEVSDILESLDIGCEQKRKIFKLAKIFITNMPNQIKKTLFHLQFLMTPLYIPKDQQDKEPDTYLYLYQELRPKILEIVPQLSIPQLKDLANLMGIILESTQFSAHVFLEALVYIGTSLPFDSFSVLMAQQCIEGIGEYPQLISNNYQALLSRMTFDKQMMPFVRENLARLMESKGQIEVAQQIKAFTIN